MLLVFVLFYIFFTAYYNSNQKGVVAVNQILVMRMIYLTPHIFKRQIIHLYIVMLQIKKQSEGQFIKF